MAGKGDKPRPYSKYKDFLENWDIIDWHKNKDQKKDGQYPRPNATDKKTESGPD